MQKAEPGFALRSQPHRRELVDTARTAEGRLRRMFALQDMDARALRSVLGEAPERAAPWVETAARFGSLAGQVSFGQMLLDGLGVERDEKAALSWFERAAGRGSVDAMNMAGRCWENGWGTSINPMTAVRWYRSSAEGAHDWGQYKYANMLFDGRGVRKDLVEAQAWYRRAANQGHTRAMNLLARCLEAGWGGARDAVQAFYWYERSATGGYFRAQFNYATLLVGLNRTEEALAYFEKSCRAATPQSLPGMLEMLHGHGDERLNTLSMALRRELLGHLFLAEEASA